MLANRGSCCDRALTPTSRHHQKPAANIESFGSDLCLMCHMGGDEPPDQKLTNRRNHPNERHPGLLWLHPMRTSFRVVRETTRHRPSTASDIRASTAIFQNKHHRKFNNQQIKVLQQTLLLVNGTSQPLGDGCTGIRIRDSPYTRLLDTSYSSAFKDLPINLTTSNLSLRITLQNQFSIEEE